ncbi:MAG: aspartate--tRNA ligase [Candidatus Omnitrophica bacterium]|nr:aspartate--tRNA ligase [Candidatus Omnitrophota bacterium]
MLRTHTSIELNESLVGKEVEVCGWVDSRRNHGKLIFIDIRDRWGKIQVVFTPKPYKDTYNLAKQLHNEYVVKVKGEVTLRPKGTENPNISTGNIELFGKELEILSSCEELPFLVEDNIEVGEEVRLFHRYLDLRRRVMLEKLLIRHKCNYFFREFLNNKGFLEIETPFLTKSTPEGARDFLVPCRLNPPKFYALPQSPQLFKQILMASGIERYFQIVRCFRDEDLRKDRQPEFTQLDIEMSFVDEEDIIFLVEDMIDYVFSKVLGINIVKPFLRLDYQEALGKYGTDKPNVGEGDYRFIWVVNFPMFEYNEEEKRWQACHHPFTSPKEEDINLLEKIGDGQIEQDKDNLFKNMRARAYDLILNGEEVAGGSIRIHSPYLQKKVFSILGISEAEAEEKFGFLLRAFRYGVPPHGGIAFGLDRLYTIITRSESIREVIAFPKTQKGICPLTSAPSSVETRQLNELSIKVVEEENR